MSSIIHPPCGSHSSIFMIILGHFSVIHPPCGGYSSIFMIIHSACGSHFVACLRSFIPPCGSHFVAFFDHLSPLWQPYCGMSSIIHQACGRPKLLSAHSGPAAFLGPEAPSMTPLGVEWGGSILGPIAPQRMADSRVAILVQDGT